MDLLLYDFLVRWLVANIYLHVIIIIIHVYCHIIYYDQGKTA